MLGRLRDRTIQRATEIKVQAERRAGQMLAEMPKNPGELRIPRPPTMGGRQLNPLQPRNHLQRLFPLAKTIAGISDEKFEAAVAAAKDAAGR